MSFDWPRMHKWEENIERDVTDGVEEQVMEVYGVDDISDLTKEQMAEIQAWREEYVSEYSPMNWGFSNLYNRWEEENYEENEE